ASHREPREIGLRVPACSGRWQVRLHQKRRLIQTRPSGHPLCPLWVRRGRSCRKKRCPLYLRKRKCAVQTRMSAKCQNRTLSASLDYLIGASDERIRNVETERPRGLEIDAQLDFPTLLDWQFAGLFTFKNSSDVDACRVIAVGDTATIAHQTASHSEL